MRRFLNIFIIILLIWGCSPLTRVTYTPAEISSKLKDKDVIKIHMKNGELYILDTYKVYDDTIKGYGIYYSINRKDLKKGSFDISIDSIALIEYNTISVPLISLAPLILMTGVSVSLTVFCQSNPKACFGSCPTFYVEDTLKAEGFSLSIAPDLEDDDIDMLYNVKPYNGELSIEVRNEALETHVIRYVNLLIAPKEKNSYVFVSDDGKFYQVNKLITPTYAKCLEKECIDLILKADGKEYFSLADDKDLGKPEEMEIHFKAEPGKTYGLIIGKRQTLLLTFLFYQTLAYAGNYAGYLLSKAKKFSNNKLMKTLEKITGIEVFIEDDGEWKRIGRIKGEGPIAIDYSLINLGELDKNDVKIKLKMTKGAIRIDYIALAEIQKSVEPIKIEPYAVLYNGKENKEALEMLLNKDKVLTTFPGDSYILKYKIPDGDWEFFLHTRGYYLEWIREEWIKEENLKMLKEIVFSPEVALKKLAPKYKAIELEMENLFWGSKYVK